MKIPSFKTPAASTISIQAVTVVYLTREKKTRYPGWGGGGGRDPESTEPRKQISYPLWN